MEIEEQVILYNREQHTENKIELEKEMLKSEVLTSYEHFVKIPELKLFITFGFEGRILLYNSETLEIIDQLNIHNFEKIPDFSGMSSDVKVENKFEYIFMTFNLQLIKIKIEENHEKKFALKFIYFLPGEMKEEEIKIEDIYHNHFLPRKNFLGSIKVLIDNNHKMEMIETLKTKEKLNFRRCFSIENSDCLNNFELDSRYMVISGNYIFDLLSTYVKAYKFDTRGKKILKKKKIPLGEEITVNGETYRVNDLRCFGDEGIYYDEEIDTLIITYQGQDFLLLVKNIFSSFDSISIVEYKPNLVRRIVGFDKISAGKYFLLGYMSCFALKLDTVSNTYEEVNLKTFEGGFKKINPRYSEEAMKLSNGKYFFKTFSNILVVNENDSTIERIKNYSCILSSNIKKIKNCERELYIAIESTSEGFVILEKTKDSFNQICNYFSRELKEMKNTEFVDIKSAKKINGEGFEFIIKIIRDESDKGYAVIRLDSIFRSVEKDSKVYILHNELNHREPFLFDEIRGLSIEAMPCFTENGKAHRNLIISKFENSDEVEVVSIKFENESSDYDALLNLYINPNNLFGYQLSVYFLPEDVFHEVRFRLLCFKLVKDEGSEFFRAEKVPVDESNSKVHIRNRYIDLAYFEEDVYLSESFGDFTRFKIMKRNLELKKSVSIRADDEIENSLRFVNQVKFKILKENLLLLYCYYPRVYQLLEFGEENGMASLRVLYDDDSNFHLHERGTAVCGMRFFKSKEGEYEFCDVDKYLKAQYGDCKFLEDF